MKKLIIAAVVVLSGCGTTIRTVEQVCQTTTQTVIGIPYMWNEVCEGTGSSDSGGGITDPRETLPE